MDVLAAVYDFIKAKIETSASVPVIRGWQSRAAVPNATDYIVLTLGTIHRIGTNVHKWDNDTTSQTDLIENIKTLAEYEVQVDFCGTDEQTVSERAIKLLSFGRDRIANEYFSSNYPTISALYADEPRSVPFFDETSQWVIRYSVTLHLSSWNATAINREGFTEVDPYIENVDVHHPVTE